MDRLRKQCLKLWRLKRLKFLKITSFSFFSKVNTVVNDVLVLEHLVPSAVHVLQVLRARHPEVMVLLFTPILKLCFKLRPAETTMMFTNIPAKKNTSSRQLHKSQINSTGKKLLPPVIRYLWKVWRTRNSPSSASSEVTGELAELPQPSSDVSGELPDPSSATGCVPSLLFTTRHSGSSSEIPKISLHQATQDRPVTKTKRNVAERFCIGLSSLGFGLHITVLCNLISPPFAWHVP